MLKPQDVLVLLKLLAKGKEPWAQGKLAVELGMSASEVNAGLKRLEHSGLVLRKDVKTAKRREQVSIVVAKTAAKEFLLYALKYIFPAKHGEPTRGMLTAWGTNNFGEASENGRFGAQPVWPDPEGKDGGFAFKPLYASVPFAAKQDKKLYELLKNTDVLRSRGSSARECVRAKHMLDKLLSE